MSWMKDGFCHMYWVGTAFSYGLDGDGFFICVGRGRLFSYGLYEKRLFRMRKSLSNDLDGNDFFN